MQSVGRPRAVGLAELFLELLLRGVLGRRDHRKMKLGRVDALKPNLDLVLRADRLPLRAVVDHIGAHELRGRLWLRAGRLREQERCAWVDLQMYGVTVGRVPALGGGPELGDVDAPDDRQLPFRLHEWPLSMRRVLES